MKKRVQLQDIADMVGVNTSTVSLILNGNARKSRISEALEQRVIEVAKELGYRPNALARSLRLGHTNVLGLIIPDLANPTFANLSRHIEEKARQYGYRLMISSSGEDDSDPSALLESMLYHQVEGVIIAPTTKMSTSELEMLASRIPLVIIDRYTIGLDVHQITFDNYAIGYLPAEHLKNRGAERIAMLSFGPSLFHMKERLDGYKRAMLDDGKDSKKYLRIVPYENTEASIIQAIDDLFDREDRPDSIIFTTNMIAVQAMFRLKEKGYRIPEDVKVVSMEAKPYYSLMKPSMTVIELPLKEMADKSIELLLGEIKNEHRMSEIIKLPVKLVPRESTE